MNGRRLANVAGFALSLVLLVGAAPAQSAETQPVIVKFRTAPDILDDTAAAEAARRQERSRFRNDLARLTGTVERARHDLRRAFNGQAIDLAPEAIKEIRALPYVAAVYPDVSVHAVLLDSAPLIGANQVWSQYGVTGSGVRVAILDTGISYTHPDLGGCFGGPCKVAGGFDFVNNDGDPRDDHGHGTHVAGIVAANGVVKGIAPDARLLAYKVLDAGGNGYSSAIIAGIDAAVDPDRNPATADGARVINLSLGGPGNPDDPMSQAVDNVTARGVTVVAAAGNDGPWERSIGSPGTARRAITVGASDKSDNLATFSSRGPVIWDTGAILKPDIVAPGVGICSTRWASSWPGAECLDAIHVALSGTSMATPHVAGVAALLLQKNPSWNPANVKAALRATALDLAQPPTTQGYGRVRALAAISLDHAPPIASIATSGAATEVLDIIGTATSPTFQYYALSIGAGLDPSTWTPIASSTQPVINGVLAADFDPLARPDGIYTLRLNVRDTSGLRTPDRTFIQVDGVQITAPLSTDSVSYGSTVEIRGNILASSQFDHYTIEYGEGYSPAEWRTAGIWLANGGTQPVQDGLLGTWNTSGLTTSGIYSLRVTVTNSWGSNVETVDALYLDPLLKAGWPVRLPFDFVPATVDARVRTSASVYTLPNRSAEPLAKTGGGTQTTTTLLRPSEEFSYYVSVGLLAPVVSDLDNDGSGEVVVSQAGKPGKLNVYSADGELLWTAVLGSSDAAFPSVPAIADIDNDGRNEIVACVSDYPTSKLFALRSDGTTVAGFPVELPRAYEPNVVIADVDRDGFKDIVVQSNGGDPRQMSIVGHHGNVMAQWTLPPVRGAASIMSTPAMGNFDDDAELEIVVAGPSEFAYAGGPDDNTGEIHVFNIDGTEVSGWPRFTPGITYSSPVVADINGDGMEDLIVGHMYSTTHDATLGGIHIYDRFGTPLPGWPQLLGEEFWSTPAVGDLDKDGVPEIAISDLDMRTWVLHANGAVASGWPQQTAWATYHSTAIADVNGDRAPDVLATAANGYSGGGVYAWTGSGTPIPGFPLYTDVDAQAGPTVADVDNDGKVEVVASSNWDFDQTKGVEKFRGSLYVWDLAGTYRGSASPWPHFHHDASHAGRFEGRCLAVSLSPPERAAKQLPATRSFTLTLTNIDGARCESRGWPLSASVPPGWSANLSTANPTVPPDSTVEVTLTVTAPTGTAEGSYPVRVTVAGDASHQPIEKSSVFLLDMTAPTVIITRPANGASYLQNSVVYASYSCSDAHLQSCVGTVAAGSRIPTATTGTKSFTVTATDRAGNVRSKTVSYTVAGGTPSYTLSPTSLTFGKRPLNLASAAKTITLNSTGSAALPVTSISLSGTNPYQFTQTNNCGSSVPAAGNRCTIWVRFRPTSTGLKTASVKVVAGGGAGTKTVALYGTGVRSTLSLSPTALAFGDVPRGVTSPAKAVTISNTGTVVLPINSITLEGTNPGQFAKTSNCPAQVPVGSSCTVNVVFKPTFTGVKSANLKVTPGGGASAKLVALSGTGI